MNKFLIRNIIKSNRRTSLRFPLFLIIILILMIFLIACNSSSVETSSAESRTPSATYPVQSNSPICSPMQSINVTEQTNSLPFTPVISQEPISTPIPSYLYTEDSLSDGTEYQVRDNSFSVVIPEDWFIDEYYKDSTIVNANPYLDAKNALHFRSKKGETLDEAINFIRNLYNPCIKDSICEKTITLNNKEYYYIENTFYALFDAVL